MIFCLLYYISFYNLLFLQTLRYLWMSSTLTFCKCHLWLFDRKYSILTITFNCLGLVDDSCGYNAETKMWTCLLCDTKFTSRGNTRRHIQNYHIPNQECQCVLCGKWHANKVLMRQHIRRIHEHKR